MKSPWGLAVTLSALAVTGWLVFRFAARSASSSQHILIKAVADTGNPDWTTLEITMPSGAGPLRLEQEIIVDEVNQRGACFTPITGDGTPRRYQFRIGDDFDRRTKEILKAQGLPVKAQNTTFNIDTRSPWGGTLDVRTLRFATSRGSGIVLGYPRYRAYKLGEPIVLYDTTFYDSSMKTYPQSLYDPREFFGDKAHRLAFQIRVSKETSKQMLDSQQR